MSFDRLMQQAGLAARPYQRDLVTQIAEHLAPGSPAALAVQAATGVGKTWALAHALQQALLRGRRIVWSTHTILLRQQVVETLARALEVAWPSPETRPVLAERRGRADYPSPSRTRRLRHALADRGGDRDTISVLDALSVWRGTLPEFIAEHGELPFASSLVCLTPACPAEEQAPYAAQRDAAGRASVVVQTHALTLIEARFKRLAADLVIFDEADTLPSVAAGAVEMRLTLDDLQATAEAAAVDLADAIATLRDRAPQEGTVLWRDPDVAAIAQDIAAQFRKAAAPLAPDLAEALTDTAEDLRQFATVDQSGTGAALVSDRAGPMLAVASVDPAAWLGSALADRQVVLMSATLGRSEDDDLARACRALGFWEVQQVGVSPGRFGEMEFRLADRSVPVPFLDGDPNPAFYDYAAQMVRQAAATGRTLVLCASYGDVQELAPRLPATALIQRRGQKLAPLVQQFREQPGAVLVTPAAWAGLDLPHLIDNVVIPRLPLGRPDPLREAVLLEALRRRGRSDVDARAVLASQAHADAMRRLTQGMGRGIRADSDRCTVWIADPRFPLPATRVNDLRRRLTQGAAKGWEGMAAAIPRRFREGDARSPYGRAVIVPRHAQPEQADPLKEGASAPAGG
jgi:ATP-dependent DNA helicase DinG